MKYRFITEYKNYILKRVKESTLSERQKTEYTFALNKTVKNVFAGLITLNECMKELARIEADFNSYDFLADTFI